MKNKYLLVLLIGLLALSGCGKTAETGTDGGNGDTDGKKVLRIAKDTAVKTLDNSRLPMVCLSILWKTLSMVSLTTMRLEKLFHVLQKHGI